MSELIRVLPKNKSQIIELYELIKEIWSEFFSFETPEKFNYILDFINIDNIKSEINNENFCYYFVNYKNKNVGFVMCEKSENSLNLSRFYIKKRFRRKGIGKEIFGKIIDIARKEDFKTIILFCDIKNKEAIKLFLKLGLIKTQILARYIGSGFYSEEIKFKYVL